MRGFLKPANTKSTLLIIGCYLFFNFLVAGLVLAVDPTIAITFPTQEEYFQTKTNPSTNTCVFPLHVTFSFNSEDPAKKIVKAEIRIADGPWTQIPCPVIPIESGRCTHNFDLSLNCGMEEQFPVEVQVIRSDDDTASSIVYFVLACINPKEEPEVVPGSSRYVPLSDTDRVVTMAFAVFNPSPSIDTYLLEFSNSLEWNTVPFAFGPITLVPDEDTSLYFETTIPGYTPEGTENVFYLIATSESDPSLTDIDSVSVRISSVRIPTLSEWGMIIFSVLLFGWMAWVIVRRRKRITVGY